MSRSKEFAVASIGDKLGSAPMPSLEGHHQKIWDGMASARTRPVRLDANINGGGQSHYYPRMVGKYVARPSRESSAALATSPDAPMMVRSKGQHWVTDGHHRVLAAKQRGDKEVDARVYDLDAGRWT